jgi:copper transport protein
MTMRRACVVAALAVTLLSLGATAASAHALVRSSSPADGAILDQPPTQVTIEFTERPDPDLSIVHVLDSTGRQVEEGAATPVPGSPASLGVGLKPIGKGVFTVTWRVVSKVDGHVTAGSFSFGVGVSPGTTATTNAPSTPSPSPLAAGGRWALYVGLALLAGGVATYLAGVGRRPPAALWMGAAWALAVVGLGLVVAAERSTVGVSFSDLLGSSTGQGLTRQAIGLAVVGIAVVWLAIRPGFAAVVAVGLATAGTMLLHAMAGHAAASGSFSWLDVGTQWLHIVSTGVWVGGLGWLLIRLREKEGADRAAAARRFSTMAGVALAAVAVTGAQRAISMVGGPTRAARLIDTSYGVTLLIKLGLFGGLVALGARNRYVNVPRVKKDPVRPVSLRRTVVAEVLIAAGIFGVTGVLTQLPPAATVAETRPAPPANVVVTGSDFATTVRVRLTVTPGSVGPNRFDALVVDYDTRRPVPATAVQLGFRLPGRPELGTPTLDLSEVSPGRWAGKGTELSMEGRWEVRVLVQQATGAVTVPLIVQTKLPPQTIHVVPGTGGQPTIYTIALPGGASVQTYVDPGTAGNNVVHFTFFTPNGDEQPIASATALATPPSGAAEDLPLTRFDAGHFVANTTLDPGDWRFQITATTPDGTTYSAYFDQRIM